MLRQVAPASSMFHLLICNSWLVNASTSCNTLCTMTIFSEKRELGILDAQEVKCFRGEGGCAGGEILLEER